MREFILNLVNERYSVRNIILSMVILGLLGVGFNRPGIGWTFLILALTLFIVKLASEKYYKFRAGKPTKSKDANREKYYMSFMD